jgi:hypothetical protein
MTPLLSRFIALAKRIWKAWISDLQDAWRVLIESILPKARRRVRLQPEGDTWQLTVTGTRSPPDPLRIDWGQADEATGQLTAWVQSNGLRGTRVAVVLPSTRVLRRRWTAPAALEHALDRAVALQVARLFPVAGAQLCWSHRVVDRSEDGLNITIEIAATHQSLLAGFSERLSSAGLCLEHAESAEEHGQPAAHRFVQTVGRARSAAGSSWTALERGLAGSAATLVLGLIVVWTVQTAREREAWANALATADAASIPAERSSRKLLSLLTPAQSLIQEATRPSAGAALSALTSQIPGDSWVSHWEWRPDATNVHVFTSNAADLTALLDSSEMTTGVQLQSAAPAPGLPGIEQAKYQITLGGQP